MKAILVCKKCGCWKEYGRDKWNALTRLDWFEFNFNPKEYSISPVICVRCKEVKDGKV